MPRENSTDAIRLSVGKHCKNCKDRRPGCSDKCFAYQVEKARAVKKLTVLAEKRKQYYWDFTDGHMKAKINKLRRKLSESARGR